MKLANLKIGMRLTLLAIFFFCTLLLVGLTGWKSLRDMTDRNIASSAETAQLLHAVDLARSAQVEFKIQVQEWKNILLRGQDSSQLKKYTDAFSVSSRKTAGALGELKTMLRALTVPTTQVDTALALHIELERHYLRALEEYASDDASSAQRVDALVIGHRPNRSTVLSPIFASTRRRGWRQSNRQTMLRSLALSSCCLRC